MLLSAFGRTAAQGILKSVSFHIQVYESMGVNGAVNLITANMTVYSQLNDGCSCEHVY